MISPQGEVPKNRSANQPNPAPARTPAMNSLDSRSAWPSELPSGRAPSRSPAASRVLPLLGKPIAERIETTVEVGARRPRPGFAVRGRLADIAAVAGDRGP